MQRAQLEIYALLKAYFRMIHCSKALHGTRSKHGSVNECLSMEEGSLKAVRRQCMRRRATCRWGIGGHWVLRKPSCAFTEPQMFYLQTWKTFEFNASASGAGAAPCIAALALQRAAAGATACRRIPGGAQTPDRSPEPHLSGPWPFSSAGPA